MKQVPIDALVEGQNADSVYFVRRRQFGTARTGKPFITLTLGDRSGEITARIFSNVEYYQDECPEGAFVYVQARVQTYEGRIQLVVDTLKRVPDTDIDPTDFLPTGRHDPQLLLAHVRDIFATIADDKVRRLCLSALDGDLGERFTRAPAAMGIHHAFLGGLLEHTLSVLILCDTIARHYPNLDRDILIAGAFFHDLGKIHELDYQTSIVYTDHGRLIPHLVISVQIVDELTRAIDDFPDDKKKHIEHICLAHHGTREFGSPVLPATVEAIVVHHLDNLDSKVFSYFAAVEKAGTAAWSDRQPHLGTYVKRTTSAAPPLYAYRLPEALVKDKNEPRVVKVPASAAKPATKNGDDDDDESASAQFDLLSGKR
ncbi:HD domain-containing protein [bacterium]|nr:HD domain-containing protein [bacterium]